MSKKRVYELAKELGIDNKELIARLEKIGIAVKSHSSSLEDSDVERIRREFQAGEAREILEQRVKSTVIRRRAVRVPAEEAKPEPAEEEAPVEAAKEAIEKAEPLKEAPKAEVPPMKPVAKPLAPVEKPAPAATPVKPVPKVTAEAPKKPAEAPAPPELKAAIKEKEGVPKKPAVSVVPPLPEPELKKIPPKREKEGPPPKPSEQPPEIKKPLPKKPDMRIVKEATPAPAAAAAAVEKPPKWDDKKKGKKPVEVVMRGEQPVPRKKALIRKFFDKKKRPQELERDEKQAGWRDDKKAAIAKMKKTVITIPKAIKRRIKVGDAITIGDFAKKIGVKAGEVITKLMGLGMMVSINQSIDCDTATLIATDFGYQVEPIASEYDESLQRPEVASENLKPRAPVVTIMGHVDHGKTSLLDAIRQTNVIAGEAGGITQAIGAYHVHINDRDIVFLDTPGHEAFTAMRARGAQVTDIVVLVVAADDGVMDQTIEAINHSRSAGVPIMVAINKIDKPGADPEKIKQALTEYNMVAEEWGGDTIYSEISAKKRTGIEELLELILLQADVLELKADPAQPARGVIIEAKLDRGRGPVATVLIQDGTLKDGDPFVCKTEFGRVRALINDQGQRVKEAGPSMPVEVIGFSGVPQVGTEFVSMEDEKKARNIGEYWVRKERERELSATSKITLEQLYQKIKEGVKELNVIVKADVQGSIEALTEALNKLGTADIKVRMIHSSTGTITETDVMLASASNAIIIGFNVRPDARVTEVAEQEGVEIKLYDIIYNVIADIKAAMEGLLEPEYRDVTQGHAEVRQLFKIPKVGMVAGCQVTDGKITRNASVKLLRDGVVMYDGRMSSLKRVKDDVREVTSGLECGIAIENFNDLREGDIIEAYIKEQVERKL